MKPLPAFLILAASAAAHGSIEGSLRTIASVGREGRGNEAATAAWNEVVQGGPTALPALLEATGTGNVVADNWLRLAGDAIVAAAARKGQTLPLDQIQAFIQDTGNNASARQLAFDLLKQADDSKADSLEPSLVNDPVQELRRGAVQRLIDAAKAKSGDEAKTAYLKALDAVRDEDQTKVIAAELKKLGTPVDLPRHFGFLTKWHVIGPFDNTGRKGFDTAFQPESGVQLDAAHQGKEKELKWVPFESTHEYGKIDLNKPLGMVKEATAYAVATVDSESERDIELRLGCKNAWKVWLNGEFLFGRDEYHRGQQMDQYKLKCRLKKGANTILVKCCQNEQKEEWTVEWEFQLRICDSAGTAILAATTAKR
jgi:hypothetical protein